jgi:hypothetical protein
MRLPLTAALLLTMPVLAVAEPAGLERWNENHKEAAVELGAWVKNHPEAAARFFEWDGNHPEKSRMLVTWAIERPRQDVDVFVRAHPGWPVFDVIMEKHRPAAEAFLAWVRRHPRAAEALMNHPRGLEWAGHHLYKEYWHLERAD